MASMAPRRHDANWNDPNGLSGDQELIENLSWGDRVELTGSPEGLSHRKAGDVATVVSYDKWGYRVLCMFEDGETVFLDALDPFMPHPATPNPSMTLLPHLEVAFDDSSWNEGHEIALEPLARIPIDDVDEADRQAQALDGFVLPNGERIIARVVLERIAGKPIDTLWAAKVSKEISVRHCDFAP